MCFNIFTRVKMKKTLKTALTRWWLRLWCFALVILAYKPAYPQKSQAHKPSSTKGNVICLMQKTGKISYPRGYVICYDWFPTEAQRALRHICHAHSGSPQSRPSGDCTRIYAARLCVLLQRSTKCQSLWNKKLCSSVSLWDFKTVFIVFVIIRQQYTIKQKLNSWKLATPSSSRFVVNWWELASPS